MICKKAREIFVAKWRDKIACDSARRSSFLIGIRYVIIGDYSQREPHPRLTPALQTQHEAERREMARERFEKAPSGTLGSCRVNSSETNSKYRKHYITSFRGALLPVRYGLVMYNSGTKRRHKGALPLVGESELSPASELSPVVLYGDLHQKSKS
jgi:hypothetical protein